MSEAVFEAVSAPFDPPNVERSIRSLWDRERVYWKSLEQRKGCESFIFYEGPPTANGMPHPGHCLTRTVKDVFPRYKTMCGLRCERKAGWDTHGLPVEVEVCKELGILDGGKRAIEQYGVEQFNRRCLDSVFRYQKEWERLTEQLGFWVDMGSAYVTYHKSYVESVWWALSELFNRGLLYQSHKVVWWWPQGGTALSAGEVGEGYRDTDDPAITVGFELTEASCVELRSRCGLAGEVMSIELLAWTTTPWTLPSNCALAVQPTASYVLVEREGRFLVLAEALVETTFPGEGGLIRRATFTGQCLVGLAYKPLFGAVVPNTEGKLWQVVEADFVTLDSGVGVVHLAPAFGADDYRVCSERHIPLVCLIKSDGTFDDRLKDLSPIDQKPIAGMFCKEADRHLIKLLEGRGRLIRREQIRHPYPFCPRAENDPLIQYARPGWFIRTQTFRDEFLNNNRAVDWQPAHIRDGRFGNFLESNIDWALSRERFWGTPLPIWQCDVSGRQEAISSFSALLAKDDVQGLDVWEQAKAQDPSLSDHLRVHKPYIDAIHYRSPFADNGRMRRVPEVIDVWFDSGAMPFAQWGYPHVEGSAQRFAESFPADFISEAIDQTRGWFYTLLAESTMLFPEKAFPHPFRHVVCLGLLLGEDGQKLSKRKKNYKDPTYLFEKYGADALRWSLLAGNAPTQSVRFTEKGVEEALREFLIRWNNVYSFFVIYANLDRFNPAACEEPPLARRAELDRWILSELELTTSSVRSALDQYDAYSAAQAISSFLDALSNWYVRRSRPRFWAHGWSDDKADAYWTLYDCLLTLAQLAAPFTPFFADATWQNLARQPFPNGLISVHLSDFPMAEESLVDRRLVEQMRVVREVVSLGLSARASEKLRVRQPLRQLELVMGDAQARAAVEAHAALIKEELNVKEVAFTDRPETFVSYEVRPNFKALGPKLGALLPKVKAALARADASALQRSLQAGSITIDVDGSTVVLDASDVEVRLSAKPGFAAAQGRGMVAILDTQVTPALELEGLAREVVHHLQTVRKEMELAYDARIAVVAQCGHPRFGELVETHRESIEGEVLAVGFECSEKVQPLVRSLDGHDLTLDVRLV